MTRRAGGYGALPLLCCAVLLLVPFALRAQQPQRWLGGDVVAILQAVAAAPSDSRCDRVLRVRRVALVRGQLVGNNVLRVCIGSVTRLRRFGNSGRLEPLDWSRLETGDLLHLQLDPAYLPSNPPMVEGTDVVLVAREVGS
jgi:hypothetical protein